MVDNISYVQGPAQPLVIIHHPHVSTASLSKGGGIRGTYRPTCLAASFCLSGSCMGGEGHGCLAYIKYTWSIGNCVTWCNIPAPSNCRSYWPLTFNPDVQLSVICKKVIAISMSFQEKSKCTSVYCEQYWTKNRALWDTILKCCWFRL